MRHEQEGLVKHCIVGGMTRPETACGTPLDLDTDPPNATRVLDKVTCPTCLSNATTGSANVKENVMAMSTAQKIQAIEAAGHPLAWDGCHKIYFLQDEERLAQAREFGYEIFTAGELRDLISDSCGLVFVSRWGFNNSDFDHPWNIDQGTQDIYSAAESGTSAREG